MVTQKQSAGIKVSQTGYSVDNAPDYALAFNSSWPSLPIVREFTVTINATFNGSFWVFADQTFTHGLGLYAWAHCWETNSPNAIGSIVTRRIDTNIIIGKNSVIWSGYGLLSSQPAALTIHVKVYNIDMSKPVAYEYVQPPVTQSPYDPNFGIKVTKEGKSIDSKDLRDFVIHSRAQSPAILSILTQANADSSGNVTYTNPQGYTNWVYGYVLFDLGSIGSFYTYAQAQGQAYPVYQFINGTTYQLSTLSGANNVSLLVLRDPLFVPAVVQVTY